MDHKLTTILNRNILLFSIWKVSICFVLKILTNFCESDL